MLSFCIGMSADDRLYALRDPCKNRSEDKGDICKDSVGIVSKKTILKNHPLVEDADEELKQIEKEEKEAQEKADLYSGAFTNQNKTDNNQDNNDGDTGQDE